MSTEGPTSSTRTRRASPSPRVGEEARAASPREDARDGSAAGGGPSCLNPLSLTSMPIAPRPLLTSSVLVPAYPETPTVAPRPSLARDARHDAPDEREHLPEELIQVRPQTPHRHVAAVGAEHLQSLLLREGPSV